MLRVCMLMRPGPRAAEAEALAVPRIRTPPNEGLPTDNFAAI